jgi:hypothetical protein
MASRGPPRSVQGRPKNTGIGPIAVHPPGNPWLRSHSLQHCIAMRSTNRKEEQPGQPEHAGLQAMTSRHRSEGGSTLCIEPPAGLERDEFRSDRPGRDRHCLLIHAALCQPQAATDGRHGLQVKFELRITRHVRVRFSSTPATPPTPPKASGTTHETGAWYTAPPATEIPACRDAALPAPNATLAPSALTDTPTPKDLRPSRNQPRGADQQVGPPCDRPKTIASPRRCAARPQNPIGYLSPNTFADNTLIGSFSASLDSIGDADV